MRQNAPMRASNKKGVKRNALNPLILLVRPARFERAAYGLEVRVSVKYLKIPINIYLAFSSIYH